MIFALLICSLDLTLPAGPPRNENAVSTIVLHHTAVASMGDSIRTLRLRGLSYHYLIDEDGKVINAVPFSRTAFHAAGANKTSVGISFTGGLAPDWAPSPKQRTAAKALIATLVKQHPSLQYLVGHGDVRDTNAGEPYGIDMAAFAEENGLHYLAKDEHPLAAYRTAAMVLFTTPRTPRKPSRSKSFPEDESVTCTEPPRHIRYKVDLRLRGSGRK
jgi:hypothetical protein